MNAFAYARASTLGEALQTFGIGEDCSFIAGGTNLIDLMKENVARPARVVDVTGLPLRDAVGMDDGGLRLGALMTNAETAYHEQVERRYPLLSKAILAGASPQIRNMATNGGNLLQRTRCYYFYDTGTPCNKRQPGTGCPARSGYNRMHAILGTSESCIAVHPSDMCVALAALDAVVHVEGRSGPRAIPFADFHRLPGDQPERDNTLQPGEVIKALELPRRGFAEHHAYLKVRDRTSYAFALVSVAAGLECDGEIVTDVRLALGGVAHKPWRLREAEERLLGKPATRANFQSVAERLLQGAKGFGHNNFKIELALRTIVLALEQAFKMERDHDHHLHRTSTEPR